MEIIVSLLDFSLTALYWIIIAQVIISWLVAFGVVNLNNSQARNLTELIQKITEPLYRPLRKFIPPIAGIDITPLIVIIAILVFRDNLLPRLLLG